jgi:hypothetical protein
MKNEFSKFGLEYVLDKIDYRLKVQQRLNGDEVFQQPYSSIADTLQRILFYKTKDGQTAAKRLSDQEVDEVYSYGEDLFFNTEKFL